MSYMSGSKFIQLLQEARIIPEGIREIWLIVEADGVPRISYQGQGGERISGKNYLFLTPKTFSQIVVETGLVPKGIVAACSGLTIMAKDDDIVKVIVHFGGGSQALERLAERLGQVKIAVEG